MEKPYVISHPWNNCYFYIKSRPTNLNCKDLVCNVGALRKHSTAFQSKKHSGQVSMGEMLPSLFMYYSDGWSLLLWAFLCREGPVPASKYGFCHCCRVALLALFALHREQHNMAFHLYDEFISLLFHVKEYLGSERSYLVLSEGYSMTLSAL